MRDRKEFIVNRIERGPSPAEALAHTPRLAGLLLGLGTATLVRLTSRRTG